MEPARVLWIGSVRSLTLEKHFQMIDARTGKQAFSLIEQQTPDVIVLDSASLRTPGERLCKQLRQRLPQTPLVHVYTGVPASVADVSVPAPVTARRLTGILQKILSSKQQEQVVACGPFAMNIARRVLIAHGQETQLTPRCALLMEIFLRSPGQIHDRRELMAKVWQTDYMGDTRTLDVHIRWIRQAIEENSSRPRYLKTVRGVGYRLDIPLGRE